jgi:hypothetical protein
MSSCRCFRPLLPTSRRDGVDGVLNAVIAKATVPVLWRACFVLALLLLAVAGWQQIRVLEAQREMLAAQADLAAYRADVARQTKEASEAAREAEQKQAAMLIAADDAAHKRRTQIEQDYQRRIAGLDADRERLRMHWGACETGRLAQGAALAGALAEADELRRASAARIVRAVELAQSERDEVIDRYNAVAASLVKKHGKE